MTEEAPVNGFIISNKLYSKLKWGIAIVLPAISTLYFTLGSIWGLPYVSEVIGSIAALTTFLGIIVGVSSKSYYNSDARYDGSVNVYDTPHDTVLYSLDLNQEPERIITKKEIVFRVNSENRE